MNKKSYLIGLLSIFLCSCVTFKLTDESMQSKDGIGIGSADMLVANPIRLEDLKRGDIVIAKVLVDSSNKLYKSLIKRIVGIPKDTVSINKGKIWIGGRVLKGQEWSDSLEYVVIGKKQDSLNSRGQSTFPEILGEEEYFLLGDNSLESYDSRNFGGVKIENISHKVIFRYWPPVRIGKVK